ncbi:MAG: hypothetical protein HPY46_08965, partial [Candidatus Aminicenantes bacterium]|nr:hypothetical protein [Candidatus Aminicenantes bacterium]
MGREPTRETRKEPAGPERTRLQGLRNEISRLLPEAMLRDSYQARERLVQLLASSLPRKNPARA